MLAAYGYDQERSFDMKTLKVQSRIIQEIDWDWVNSGLSKNDMASALKSSFSKKIILSCGGKFLREAKKTASPKIISSNIPIKDCDSGLIETNSNITLSVGKKLASYLKKATHVEVFIATIGPRLENEASRLGADGEYLESYILDRIGSLAVESLASNFEKELRKYYESRNASVSMRVSPGYCGWRLEEQALLDKILDFSRAGVGLTERFMMVPRKSISAIMGIGSKNIFGRVKSPCDICEKIKICEYKRVLKIS